MPGVVAEVEDPVVEGQAALDRARRPVGPAQLAVAGVQPVHGAVLGAEEEHAVREHGRGLAARAQRPRPQHAPAALGVGRHAARRHPVQALEHDRVDDPVGHRRRRRRLSADLALPHPVAVVGPQRDQGAVVLEDEQPPPGHDRRELDQVAGRRRPQRPERRAQVGRGGQVAAAVLGVAVVRPDEGGAALLLGRRLGLLVLELDGGVVDLAGRVPVHVEIGAEGDQDEDERGSAEGDQKAPPTAKEGRRRAQSGPRW